MVISFYNHVVLQRVMCNALWIQIYGEKPQPNTDFFLFMQNRKESWGKHPEVLVAPAQKGLVQQEGKSLGVMGGTGLSWDSAGAHLSLLAPQGDGSSGLWGRKFSGK